MLIKSLSRQAPSFGQLLHYLTRDDRPAGEPLRHNLITPDGRDLAAIAQEFLSNARHAPDRHHGVALYHEILSLSRQDADHITPAVLTDLAQQYLARRAPQALAYGVIHLHPQPHLHLVIAAHLPGQRRKLRLSRADFDRVKRDLQAYEQARYPALIHSPVLPREPAPLAPAVPPRRTVAEDARARRQAPTGPVAPDRKDALRERVLRAFAGAHSAADFRAHLQQAGLSLYERGGQPAGVIDHGQKHRFRTLGLAAALAAALTGWARQPERRRRFDQRELAHTHDLVRAYGYAQALQAVIRKDRTELTYWRAIQAQYRDHRDLNLDRGQGLSAARHRRAAVTARGAQSASPDSAGCSARGRG